MHVLVKARVGAHEARKARTTGSLLIHWSHSQIAAGVEKKKKDARES